MSDKPDLRKLIESLLRQQFTACSRCKRTPPSDEASTKDWGVRTFLNRPIGILCPDCQSDEERAESEIRQATSTYTIERGRVIQHPKPSDDDEGE